MNLDGFGITKTRQAAIKNTTQNINNNHFQLSRQQTFESFHKAFSALKGIGDWTVSYDAMRGLGMKDCFPATDLGVVKALGVNGKTLTKKQMYDMAEQWRPYRSYATLCLWNCKE